MFGTIALSLALLNDGSIYEYHKGLYLTMNDLWKIVSHVLTSQDSLWMIFQLLLPALRN